MGSARSAAYKIRPCVGALVAALVARPAAREDGGVGEVFEDPPQHRDAALPSGGERRRRVVVF